MVKKKLSHPKKQGASERKVKTILRTTSVEPVKQPSQTPRWLILVTISLLLFLSGVIVLLQTYVEVNVPGFIFGYELPEAVYVGSLLVLIPLLCASIFGLFKQKKWVFYLVSLLLALSILYNLGMLLTLDKVMEASSPKLIDYAVANGFIDVEVDTAVLQDQAFAFLSMAKITLMLTSIASVLLGLIALGLLLKKKQHFSDPTVP